jgi:hypothetical protein
LAAKPVDTLIRRWQRRAKRDAFHFESRESFGTLELEKPARQIRVQQLQRRKVKENMQDDRETGDYEVGDGRPPKSGQFKKGVSGNPSGRGKPSDFDAKLLRELNSPLMINENGQRRVITKHEGIAKQAVNKALSGHVQSMRLVDNWRRYAVEKAAEERQRAQYMANQTVKNYSDEELESIIKSESDKPIPNGADGGKPGNDRKIGN